MKKVQLHTAEEVINGIHINLMSDDRFSINLSSVNIWRMNWPYNCFALDLINNTEVQQKGIQSIWFMFPLIENTSVKIMPQGKELACNREVQSLNFYSSGDKIIIENLGEVLLD